MQAGWLCARLRPSNEGSRSSRTASRRMWVRWVRLRCSTCLPRSTRCYADSRQKVIYVTLWCPFYTPIMLWCPFYTPIMLWCPFYTPISAVSSWGWWLHATSASGRRAPATEHIWMPLMALPTTPARAAVVSTTLTLLRRLGRRCYVMVPLLHTHQRRKQLGVVAMLWCPFYTPISAVSSRGWWLHGTSASGRRAPATGHIWVPQSTLDRRRVHWVRVGFMQLSAEVFF
jgi:hypothetical protein